MLNGKKVKKLDLNTSFINKFEEITINNCLYQQVNSFNQEVQIFDIKIVECIWESSFSLMIMLYDVTEKVLN